MVSILMERAVGLGLQTPVSFMCGSCYCDTMPETGTLHLPQEKSKLPANVRLEYPSRLTLCPLLP